MNQTKFTITKYNNKFILNLKINFETEDEANNFLKKIDFFNIDNNIDNNTDIKDIDEFFEKKIVKSEKKSDFVRLIDLYKNNKMELLKYDVKNKKEFFINAEYNPTYKEYYRARNYKAKHILKGFKLIEANE